MIISIATDSGFAGLAGTLVRSIVINGGVPDAEIVCFADRLTADDKTRLLACARPMSARIVDLDEAVIRRIGSLPLPQGAPYLNSATYIRLLLPQLLPQASRTLYLDSDCLVLGSLHPLTQLDLEGRPLAGVLELGEARRARLNQRLGHRPDRPYINAGVLVMDLDQWRERELSERCLEVVSWSRALMVGDQDAVNAILGDEVLLLDGIWNVWDDGGGAEPDYSDARIVHFVGPTKPDMVGCRHPMRSRFIDIRAETPWRRQPLRGERGIRALIGRMRPSARPRP